MRIGVKWVAAAPPSPPDLTQSPKVETKLTYNLGATGLRGWIYTKPEAFLDSVQGRTTTASRQILVTHVGVGSPAEGIMKVGDVILGVEGQRFNDDARHLFGRAIQTAEKESNKGILTLTRWRSGTIEEVRLLLRVMGEYTPTAPYRCAKSARILNEAAEILAKQRVSEDWAGAVSGLALLATGNPDYIPKLRQFARKLGPPTLKLELKDGMVVWDWGYRTVFLSEYYLATGDSEALHAINQYTINLAKGQGLYGTFGHGISSRTPKGELHGSIPPYGPVNSAGLIGNMAIVLGRKCGVRHPEVEAAIERGGRFFAYFVDKGAVPYGEHMPWPNHENNGKNSMAAQLFALRGDRPDETRFFARMATAGHANREYGHTGQGFSYLWGALGAAAGGPDAAAAFFKEASWHFDLVRRSDGSFTYDGGEQYGAGQTEDDTYFGRSSYDGLSPEATYVLTYALPLGKLYLTGKEAQRSNWLTATEAKAAVASGHFDKTRHRLNLEELLTAFADWSPVVRGWAAEEFSRRPEATTWVPRLITMAGGEDARLRQSACEALGYLRNTNALPILVRSLTHEDRWLRIKAAEALKRMRDLAKPVVPEMLRAVVVTAEPLSPVAWADPIQLTHGELAEALFDGLLRKSIRGVDTNLLYPAIRAVAKNADGMARMRLRATFEKQLTLEDVIALAPDILEAVKTPSPADTMFSNEIRMGGFKALTRYQFKEGIEAGILFAKTQGGHGSESRTGLIMKEISAYGTAARSVVPQLRELIVDLNAQCKRGEFPTGELNHRRVSAVEEAIRVIEAATTQPDVRSIPVAFIPTGIP